MKSINDVVNYLKNDPLKYIVHLKMLAAYPEHIVWHVETVAGVPGVVIRFPTSVSAFDVKTYPASKWIVLIAAPNAQVAERLLKSLPGQETLVFKLVDDLSKAAVRQAFPAVERMTAYVSYTAQGIYSPDEAVLISEQLDDRLVPCYQTNGYTLQELAWFFDNGAITFSLYADEPLSTCFAFKNYGEIWEIGGVFTSPAHRRRGFGRRVVATAVSTLLERGKTPRYQVVETNRASLKLAESLGLEQFVITEHYLYSAT